jgi:hypothetical protein
MTFQTKFQVLGLSALALAFAQTALADSSCVNVGTPSASGIVDITCNLYYNGATTSFNLAPLMTQVGSSGLLANDISAGYLVVINGNPGTISDSDAIDAALFAPASVSDWEAVLYFPNTLSSKGADTLDAYFAGAFPANLASTVQSVDEGLYGAGVDSEFFTQSTGLETTISNGPDVLNVYTAPATTPEPSSFILLFSGLSGVGLLARIKRPSQA